MLFVNRVLVFFGAKEGLCLLPKIKRNYKKKTGFLIVKQQCFISKKMKCIQRDRGTKKKKEIVYGKKTKQN